MRLRKRPATDPVNDRLSKVIEDTSKLAHEITANPAASEDAKRRVRDLVDRIDSWLELAARGTSVLALQDPHAPRRFQQDADRLREATEHELDELRTSLAKSVRPG